MFASVEEAIAFADKKDQDGGRPVFYIKAVDQKDLEGEVTSVDQVWVKIHNIGDPKNIQDRPKRPEDEKRWPEYWKAYRDETEAPTDGTPIKSFPGFTPADIQNLSRRMIKTVEEFISIPDQEINNILGGKAFATKRKAQEFLVYRENNGDVSELLDRIAELEKLVGDNTDNGTKRAEGDGVSESIDSGGERKSRRSNSTGARKKKRKKAG